MAYDKVVDSAVLNAGLTQIANAIREKAGTSDSLAFPAAMAEAIAAIEAGGDYECVQGTIVPAETVSIYSNSPLVIEHNLGYIPDLVVLWRAEGISSVNNQLYFGLHALHGGSLFGYYSGSNNASAIKQTILINASSNISMGSSNRYYQGSTETVTSTTVSFMTASSSSAIVVASAGNMYRWLAVTLRG